jgi:hypothetical protein
MFNSQLPPLSELPTSRQLVGSTFLAAGAAATLLASVVLPSEYGIDPTGVGNVLGLTQMGKIKAQLAEKAAAAEAADAKATTQPAASAPAAAVASDGKLQTSEVTLTLQPDQGEEVKATMVAGGEIDYSWSTDGAKVNFELHGEQKGAASGDYTSYEKGTSAGESGKFRAPFDGTHGWFWRNRTNKPLTITVKATGSFQKFELVQ